MWPLLRPLVFGLDAELAHTLALDVLASLGDAPRALAALRRRFAPAPRGESVNRMGLSFAHPLGLAAGWDKDARAGAALFALGFSHVEFGTVTRLAQVGNPRPRVFRVEEARALVNSMGFPNAGLEAMLDNLAKTARSGVIGVNVGKNKHTANEHAGREMAELVRRLAGRCDYLTLNVSSPNTPGLRALSAASQLEATLRPILAVCGELAAPPPLLLKISPDDDDRRLRDVAQIVSGMGLAGMVATNTTVRRDALPIRAAAWPGGASGPCVAARSDEVLALLREALGPGATLIGVGGVDSRARLRQKLEAGADLVQAFTGFVYGGPSFVRDVLDGT